MNTAEPEEYLPVKQIPAELWKRFRFKICPAYVYAIKAETESRNEELFAAGQARPSEVMAWIRANPKFRYRSARRAAV